MSRRCPGAGWGESPKPPLGNQLSSFILRGCHRGKLRITSRRLHGSVLYHAQSFNLCRDPARTASVSPQGDQCQQRGCRLLRAPTSSPVNRANDIFWAGWGTDRVPAGEGEALAPCSLPDKMLHGEVHLSSTDFSNRGERAICRSQCIDTNSLGSTRGSTRPPLTFMTVSERPSLPRPT